MTPHARPTQLLAHAPGPGTPSARTSSRIRRRLAARMPKRRGRASPREAPLQSFASKQMTQVIDGVDYDLQDAKGVVEYVHEYPRRRILGRPSCSCWR